MIKVLGKKRFITSFFVAFVIGLSLLAVGYGLFFRAGEWGKQFSSESEPVWIRYENTRLGFSVQTLSEWEITEGSGEEVGLIRLGIYQVEILPNLRSLSPQEIQTEVLRRDSEYDPRFVFSQGVTIGGQTAVMEEGLSPRGRYIRYYFANQISAAVLLITGEFDRDEFERLVSSFTLYARLPQVDTGSWERYVDPYLKFSLLAPSDLVWGQGEEGEEVYTVSAQRRISKVIDQQLVVRIYDQPAGRDLRGVVGDRFLDAQPVPMQLGGQPALRIADFDDNRTYMVFCLRGGRVYEIEVRSQVWIPLYQAEFEEMLTSWAF